MGCIYRVLYGFRVFALLFGLCGSFGMAYAQVPAGGARLVGKVSLEEYSKGAGVVINSLHSGTRSAGEDGRFELLIKRFPETFKFSAVGYHPLSRTFKSPSDIPGFLNLKMLAIENDLGEVVVNTGYQKVASNEVNGDISLISQKMLNARTGTNILDRIIGQTSGILFNTDKSNGNSQNRTNFSVRGLGRISGPLDPLVVLDGFIYEGDINNINPTDIENVSVLKDAAAAAIWGARAGNGVIVLTSKKGRLNSVPVISFTANTTVRSLPDLGKFPMMSASDYLSLEAILFERGYYNNRINNNLGLTSGLSTMLLRRQGKISQAEEARQLDILRGRDMRDSYLKDFYTQAVLQQYGISLRGGTDKLTYSLSGNYDRSLSESYAKSDRINLRFGQDYKVSKNLTFSTNVQLSSHGNRSGRPVFGLVSNGGKKPSYLAFTEDNGDAIAIEQNYSLNFLDTLAGGKLLPWRYYPALDHQLTFTETARRELFGTAGLVYKISDDLTADLSYQFQDQRSETVATNELDSYLSRTTINSFSQFNRASGLVSYNVPMGGIRRSNLQQTASSTGRFQLNFNKIFSVHAINAIAGVEARDVHTQGSGSVLYGYQADPLTYREVDYVSAFPDMVTGNSSMIPGGSSLTELRYRFLSFYSNVAYTLLGKYRLSGSIRKDGSNIFGASTNDKWKPLFSASAGWELSSERFYNLKWLPVLRLTGSYGHSGNVDLSRTAASVAVYGSDPTTGLPFARVRDINNPELRWEQLSQFNLKLDFAGRRNLVRGSVSFYIKNGSDLYGPSLYDYTGWGRSDQITRNVAAMRGEGLDAELHVMQLNSGALKWNTDLYYSYNQSRTTAYYYAGTVGLGNLLGSGSTINPIVGQPLYALAAYRWAGLDASGNPQGYLAGVPSKDYAAMAIEASTSGGNVEYIGPASPSHFGSMINTLSYRNFSLSFNISFRLGYFKRKTTMSYNTFAVEGVGHSDYAKRWQNPGDELLTTVPSFVYPMNLARDSFYGLAAPNFIAADNIRLDYINLSYQLDATNWRFPMRSLELFCNASNLGILWRANRDNVDPDYVNTISPFKGITMGIRGSF